MSDHLDFELKLSAAVKVFATNADAPFDPSVVAASALADRNRGWRIGVPTIDVWRVAAVVGAVAVLAVAVVFALNFLSNRPGLVGPQPTEATSSVEPTVAPGHSVAPASGGMWPQSTLEEVRAAQDRADAGDPDYTWQVGAQLIEETEQ